MLKGKTALVTGSTSGIGLAIARSLAEAGANIVMNGLGSPQEIESAKMAVAAYDTDVSFQPANLRNPDEIRAMMAKLNDNGGVDILVNNAGIQFVAAIQDFPDDKWDDVIAINLSSAFHTTKHAVPKMLEKGWGRIINIASVHGLTASINKSAYIAAKHGIVGLTRATAVENAEAGITCNAICPGWVHTPLVEKQIVDNAALWGISREDAAKRMLETRQPSKNFVLAEQLGGLAVFLCSPSASQMTGQALPMDGGWTAL